MSNKLKGAFHGCPHHGDDYEACIQHSGTAPCGVTEERDEYHSHLTVIAEMTGDEGDIGAAWESVNALQEALVASEKREQALAAHLERLTGLLEEHHEDFMSDGSADWDESDWDGRVAHALEDTPETSLAKLKAEWRADALHELLMHPREATLRKKACETRDDYRRQAEEALQ